MARAFEDANGTLAERMIESLRAGQKAGGDKRGRQSAALLIVRIRMVRPPQRLRDLRVDDHPTPIEELERIYRIHRKVFPYRPLKKAKVQKNILFRASTTKFDLPVGHPLQ